MSKNNEGFNNSFNTYYSRINQINSINQNLLNNLQKNNSDDSEQNNKFGEMGVKKTYLSAYQINDKNNENEKKNIIIFNQNINILKDNDSNDSDKIYKQNKDMNFMDEMNKINSVDINPNQIFKNNSLNEILNIKDPILFNPSFQPDFSSKNINNNDNFNPFSFPFFNQKKIEPLNAMNNIQNLIYPNSIYNNFNNNSINSNYYQNKRIYPQQNPNQYKEDKNRKNQKGNFNLKPKDEKPVLNDIKNIDNIDNISYLISVLQLICSIDNFTEYFLNPENKDLVDKYELTYQINCFCSYLHPQNGERNKYDYNPILGILGNYNIIYKDYERKNANDFICFLLNKLHDELYWENNKDEPTVNIQLNSINDDTIEDKLNKFREKNKSIIFDLFHWFQIKKEICKYCRNTSFSLQNFKTFELNIVEYSRLYHTREIKLTNCLHFYKLLKTKKQFCNFCQRYEDVTTSKSIYLSSKYFIFLLDINPNNNINFIFEKRINLEKFMETKEKCPTFYELSGIVFYIKNEKKYNSLCISSIDKKWYLYDKEKVEIFDLNKFISLCKKNGIYIPCILIYKG